MATVLDDNYQSRHTGEEIDRAIDLLLRMLDAGGIIGAAASGIPVVELSSSAIAVRRQDGSSTYTSYEAYNYYGSAPSIATITKGTQLIVIPDNTGTAVGKIRLTINDDSSPLYVKWNEAQKDYGPFQDRWFVKNHPYLVIYDGEHWIADVTMYSLDTFTGVMPVAKGGTGSAHPYSALHNLGIKPGTIVLWNGGGIPQGWAECNGENGTPSITSSAAITGVKYIINLEEPPAGETWE